MKKPFLPEPLLMHYELTKSQLQNKLMEFAQISGDDIFYEMCYCVCTPQSKAENAMKVQNKLMSTDFLKNDFDPTIILFDKSHYIRFHNQKAKRLHAVKMLFPSIRELLQSQLKAKELRYELIRLINGFGYKESSHFLRNIGYRNLAILDRHILKHLLNCNVIEEIPKSITPAKYIEIENKFIEFGNSINIPMDELDLLFWSYETGIVLK